MANKTIKRHKVIDRPELEKDLSSGLVVNTDRTALQAAKAKKKAIIETQKLAEEQAKKLAFMEEKINRLETLLLQLLPSKETNG